MWHCVVMDLQDNRIIAVSELKAFGDDDFIVAEICNCSLIG